MTGAWTDVASGLEGDVAVSDWWPDGGSLLVSQLHDGRYRLHRFDLETCLLEAIEHLEGQVVWARVRPDGAVWYRHATGAPTPRILDDDGREVLPLEGEPAPSGRPFVSIRFDNRHGDSVQGFLAHRRGGSVHPRPTARRPDVAGRGQVAPGGPVVRRRRDGGRPRELPGLDGRGAEWRDALIGDVGGPELEDLNDALDHLIARAADAAAPRSAVVGWVPTP